MRIKTIESENGVLVLSIKSEDDNTRTYTHISSILTGKVEEPIVNEVHNLVMQVGRYNGLSDTDIVKNFVENTLTEKEIRELITKLEN